MGPFEKYNPLPLSVNGKKLDSNVKSNNNGMWPALIGAVAAIAGSVVSSISNRNANKRNVAMQQQTNAQNYQIFQEQQQFNKEQFDRQLEYSVPANQMQRYRDAGINPYIAVGQISSGTPSSALTSVSSAPMQSSQVQPNTAIGDGLQNLGAIVQAYSQAKLADSQARLNDANAKYVDRKSEAEIFNINNQGRLFGFQSDNSKFDFDLKSDTRENTIKLSDMSLSQAEAYIDNLKKQSDALDIANSRNRRYDMLEDQYLQQTMEANLDKILADVALTKEQKEVARSVKELNDYDRQTYKPGVLANERSNIAVRRREVAVSEQRARDNHVYTVAQCEEISARIASLYEDTTGKKIDNETRSKLNQFVIDNYAIDNQNKYADGYFRREQVKGLKSNKASRGIYLGSKTAGEVLEPLFNAVGIGSKFYK